MVSSSIKVSSYPKYNPVLCITYNEAEMGGGLYLEANSKLYITKKDFDSTDVIFFMGNEADYGGALYVADETYSGTCTRISFKQQDVSTECFSIVQSTYDDNTYTIDFTDNHAAVAGSILYGGLLDRCTVGLSVTGAIYYTMYQHSLITSGINQQDNAQSGICLLYTSPSPRDATLSRMPSSA